jgi:hypothetical protein
MTPGRGRRSVDSDSATTRSPTSKAIVISSLVVADHSRGLDLWLALGDAGGRHRRPRRRTHPLERVPTPGQGALQDPGYRCTAAESTKHRLQTAASVVHRQFDSGRETRSANLSWVALVRALILRLTTNGDREVGVTREIQPATFERVMLLAPALPQPRDRRRREPRRVLAEQFPQRRPEITAREPAQ